MGSRRKQKTEKSMIQNLYWKQVFRSPKTKIGLMVVIIFALAAIFAPVLAPHDPLLVDVSIKLKNPSAAYPLGTDQLGRCILSRLLYGAQTTLLNSLVVLAGQPIFTELQLYGASDHRMCRGANRTVCRICRWKNRFHNYEDH